jgi:hypothetical protein
VEASEHCNVSLQLRIEHSFLAFSTSMVFGSCLVSQNYGTIFFFFFLLREAMSHI